MPVPLDHPGAYVEEIPDGARTITGVATSITAFVGRAARGPTDQDPDAPVTIESCGEFERAFGELDPAYPMGYAVRDFYLNGGGRAVIARLFEGTANAAKIAIANLPLLASSAGSWANGLRARIDIDVSHEVAVSLGLRPADLFNLTVRDMFTGARETFLNVSVKDSARRVDRVLEASSLLVRIDPSARFAQPPASPPVPPPATPSPDADPDPETDPGKTIWDDGFSTGVTTPAADSGGLSEKTYQGDESAQTGIFALQKVDLFNLLCLPPDVRGGDTPAAVYQAALSFCVTRRAVLIVDAPSAWTSATVITQNDHAALKDLNLEGAAARNAALYFPRVIQSDPARQGQLDTFAPCGIVAGVMARTDAQRGVWTAPAGTDAALHGVHGLAASLTNDENGRLNQIGINCLRSFPSYGPVVWGARTLRGANLLADDYKYVPVRRLALFIEESLYRGTRWAAFEPNDEPLWAEIRRMTGVFMQNLFRQGAFQGQTSRDAYFVKCDKETTTQDDVDLGIVHILVGFAPLKPAEFVVILLQQTAGQIRT